MIWHFLLESYELDFSEYTDLIADITELHVGKFIIPVQEEKNPISTKFSAYNIYIFFIYTRITISTLATQHFYNQYGHAQHYS